ncbi:speckle-type POZ protein-like A [Aphidius gifuensis]|uniref:speckle-type POZ protein-like A n=1 Tax=Aphidius gifuensis TaxID=684658 RepID=UPI001CDBDF4A|nr:speckle-type POZ protein-like A [Aphidius gifuensis]
MSKEGYVNSMETYEFAYMWTIKNFGQWAKPKIISPSFSSHYSDANDEWVLQIERSGQHLWMRVQLQSFNNFSHYLLKAECEISNKDDDILCTCGTHRFNQSPQIVIFNATQQLSADLKKLLSNEQLSDVTIQVGQKSFPAIKGILAVRSPVFFAMFSHEQLKENQKNEVVIEDIDEDVFEEFLYFIYTGKSLNIEKMPMELLAVAEKYQVDYLKNI